MKEYQEPAFQRAKKQREVRKDERDNLKTQLRAQIAGQASWTFVLLNAGGLAAILTWMQSLPLEPHLDSCNYALLHNLPWAAALLLLGVLATAISYILRYHASFKEVRAIGWMVALSLSAICLVAAGGWAGYTVTNCRSIAFQAKFNSDLESLMASARLSAAANGKECDWEYMRQRDNEARSDLQFAILESSFNETVELEKKLKRIRELKAEFSSRHLQYGPTAIQFETRFREAVTLEKELEAQLRGSDVAQKEKQSSDRVEQCRSKFVSK